LVEEKHIPFKGNDIGFLVDCVIWVCRYNNVPFTKNTEKYIKYAPAQVSALIDRFFDVAA
jgi:hypothetical protein